MLPIAVTNHIDVIGGSHNDGITWCRDESVTPALMPPHYLEQRHMASSQSRHRNMRPATQTQ